MTLFIEYERYAMDCESMGMEPNSYAVWCELELSKARTVLEDGFWLFVIKSPECFWMISQKKFTGLGLQGEKYNKVHYKFENGELVKDGSD